MPKQCKLTYIMAVMTLVITAFLVACSVDETDDTMSEPPYNQANSVNASRFRIRWIADKKSIGNTWATIERDYDNYNMEMSEWTLPVEYILTGKLQGNGEMPIEGFNISGHVITDPPNQDLYLLSKIMKLIFNGSQEMTIP